jgi:hypothetical protein
MTSSKRLAWAGACIVLTAVLGALFFVSTREHNGPFPRLADPVPVLFERHCSSCHGRDGDGKGATAKMLKLKMQDFRDCRTMERFTNDTLFSIIKSGAAPYGRSAAMPGWERTLSPMEIQGMVRHVRRFCGDKPN